MIPFRRERSRLKKKLTLYFILIAVVSISVSVEMIFEFNSAKFRNDIRNNVVSEITRAVPGESVKKINTEKMNDAINRPVSDLRNRMILLLLVVFASIVGAFIMFAKDIVSPMDNIVEATKKIADGDLTVTVPVMSEDEIGQIATLINDMNINLQDMIMQIRQEISRHRSKILEAGVVLTAITKENAEEIITNKRMKLSDFRRFIQVSNDVVSLLDTMLIDLGALENFVKMYKTYAVHTEINQRELDKVLNEYNVTFNYEDEE